MQSSPTGRQVLAAQAVRCREPSLTRRAGRPPPPSFPHWPPASLRSRAPAYAAAAESLRSPALSRLRRDARDARFSSASPQKSSLLAPQKRVPASEATLGGRASPPSQIARLGARYFCATASRPHASREAVGLLEILCRLPRFFPPTERKKLPPTASVFVRPRREKWRLVPPPAVHKIAGEASRF